MKEFYDSLQYTHVQIICASEKIFISAITMTSKISRCGVCDKSLLGGKMSKRGDTLLCRFIFWQDGDDDYRNDMVRTRKYSLDLGGESCKSL